MMKVICAGGPKTGTKSIAKALRILGYDPVYDVEEAIEFAFKEWEDVFSQKQPDLTVLMKTAYADVEAVVDAPHSIFFEQFLEHWPNAKVILMTRDEDVWFRSFKKMIDRAVKDHGRDAWFRYFSPSMHRLIKFQENMFYMTVGGVKPHSLVWRNWYRRHNAYVRSTVPKDQLLEYNVTQGWDPLCAFLNKPIPNEEFPFENRAVDARNVGDRMMEDAWLVKKAAMELTFVFMLAFFVLIAILAKYFYF